MNNVSTVTYDVFSDENLNSFYFYETEQLTVLWILFVVTVTGNAGVLLAVLHSNRKSRMNYFIKHLAFADLLVGLVNILTDIIWKMTIVWYAGNIACKAIRYFQALITYSSTYVLVALSLDRYDAIKHPMKFSGSWQKARWLIISAWTFSAIFSIPMLFFYEEKYIQDKLQCWIDFPHLWQWKLYMSLVSTALFIIPTIIIATCYTIIVHVIRSKTIIQVSKKYEIRTDGGRWKKTVSRGLIPRAKVKTVKVTVVIVSVFIICWSPFIIFDLLQVYGFIPQTQQNIAIATFMQSLAPLNSAANPIIYCVFSTDVFKSLCKLLRRCRPISRKESPNPTNTQSSSLTEFLTKTDTQQKRKNTLVQYKNRRTEVHL